MSRLLIAIVSVMMLVGCGGTPGVVTVVIDPPNLDLQQGQTARFTVSVTGTSDTAVTWTATGGRLISKGSGATFVALEAGSFEVTATSMANPSVAATATVLVTAAPGEAHLRFVTDGSLVLAGERMTRRVEVEVIDESGALVDGGQVTWSSSDPAVVSVVADGDRAAVVTTETSTTSQALVTASFDGLAADASVLVTRPSQGTVLIDNGLVLAKTPTSVTLRRDAVTEALTPGQRLVSGSATGVLAEVLSVDVGEGEVEVTTSPSSLAEAFDEFSFAGEVNPTEVTVQLVDGAAAVVTTRSPDGRLRSASVLDDVTCTSAGAPAQVDLVGSSITVTATIYGELAFSVFLGNDQFLAKFGAALQVGASTGTVAFGGAADGTVVCSLELPSVGIEPLSAGVATLWTGFVPVIGVEVEATSVAASLSLSGPHGGLGAVLEGGIQYTEASGWQPLLHSEIDAEFEPFSAEASFEEPVAVRLAPFGRVDVGIRLDLGVDEFAASIIDARFVELKGYGYLDFTLPGPTDVGSKGYGGPEWSLGLGARGALKAEFQGLLPDLLQFVGIDVNFAGQVELFEEETLLLTQPSLTFLATPATVEVPAGGSSPVTLSAFSSDDENGTVSFWASKDGSSSLTFLTSAALEGGSATTSWHVTEEGEYELYARMSSDAASLVKPYAANNTSSVSVTEGDEEGDSGPLGNEGPFGGVYTHFSLGQCDDIGVGLTIDFVEQPNGTLMGTYVGHYCEGGCFDVDTYPSGPVTGTLSGSRSGAEVIFALSAPVGGLFTGERWVPEAPPGSVSLPVIDGFAEGVLPCEDAYGTSSSGFFTFVGTEGIWF